jgi:hypothetical protein
MDKYTELINELYSDSSDEFLNIERLFIDIMSTINEGSKVNKVITNNKKIVIQYLNIDTEKIKNMKTNNQQNNTDENNTNENIDNSNDKGILNPENTVLDIYDVKDVPSEDIDNEKNNIIGEEQFESVEDFEEKKNLLLHKLYKLIAVATHPDKSKKENNVIFFIKSKEAYDTGDLLLLLYIFYKVSIPYNNISSTDINIINREVQDKNSYIENQKNQILYKWDSLQDEVKEEYINVLKKHNSNIL